MRSWRAIGRHWTAFLGVSLCIAATPGCGDEPSTTSGSSSSSSSTSTSSSSSSSTSTSSSSSSSTSTSSSSSSSSGQGGAGGSMGTGGGGGAGGGMQAVCGDGTVTSPEECDDGNAVPDDGCTDACVVAPGYTCTGSPSQCTVVCGDGMIIGAEACDDGNTVANDGCSAACAVEAGFQCTGTPSLCTATCGDGLVAGPETCDDGNTVANDGCSATCTAEMGWQCTGMPSQCSVVCGDGMIIGAEQCDGANLNNQTCIGMGYNGGMLACTIMCTFDTSGCTQGEVCNNGQDDDGDMQIDCADADCAATAPCNSQNETTCNDFIDNDGDGLTDCEDPDDCKNLAICQPGGGAVGTPCDSPSDCAANNMDPFCIDEPQFGWPAGYCSEFCDPVANDCAMGAICVQAGTPSGAGLCLDICNTGADCRMGYDCLNFGPANVCFPIQEDCTNGIDDNQNGLTDCADPACNGDPACLENICNDMVDNDQDGMTDCMDPDCEFDPACLPQEICSGGIDEDQDGWIDCDDPDCANAPGCNQGALCMGPIPLTDGVPYSGTTIGGSDAFYGSCTGGAGALERIFTYTPSVMGQDGVVTITLSSATDQGIYVRANCVDPGSEVACTDLYAGGTDEQLVIPVQGGVTLTIFVDGWYDPAEAGPFILTAVFSMPVCGNGMVEPGEQCDPPDGVTCDNNCQDILPNENVCNNFFDDDNDGLTDCEDPTDCKMLPICQPGNTPTGGMCTLPSDCVANDTDPFCIDETQFSWPGGYCTQFCDPATNDCPAGSHCVPTNVPSGAGLCWDHCNTVMDCRAGYQCLDIDGSGQSVCVFN